MWDEGMTFCCQ